MHGHVITTTEEPTGAGPWTYLADGLDVANILAHWDADSLTPPPSSYVGPWKAATTDHTLTGAAAAVQNEGDGHQRVRFDGVDDYLFLNAGSLGIKTVAVLVRWPVLGTPGSYISLGGTYLRFNGSGYNVVGGTTQYPTFARSADKWSWLFVSMDGAARTVAQNAEAPVTGTGLSAGITKIELGRNIEGGDYGGQPFYVAAVAAFTRVLTAAERAKIWSALQFNRPAWAA